MAEPSRPRVVRYQVIVGKSRDLVYGDASTSPEAERLAIDAAREHPGMKIWTRVVGEGRNRAARAAARERFPEHKVVVRFVTETPEMTHYEVRARRRVAGGWNEVVANCWVSELGKATWGGE